MHKPIIQGSVAWQDLIDQGYVVISREDYDALTKWRPIETAPKDGTEILGHRWYKKREGDTYEFFNVVYWEKGIGWCLLGGDCIRFPVTHWMPLPEPPHGS